MATIIENKRNGRIVSYKFRAYLGKAENGKQITQYITWSIPDGLSQSKAKKAAMRAAAEWEEEVRQSQGELAEHRIYENTIIVESNTTDFVRFVYDEWFPLCVYDGRHKPKTVVFYEQLAKGITEYFKGAILERITALDIERYLVYLQTKHITARGKTPSDKTIRDYYCLVALIFKFALNHDFISKNPLDKVACPKLARRKRVDALNKEETELFFSLLPSCPPEFRCMLYLLITTGIDNGCSMH